MATAPSPKTLRCAIYTRKSSEEGLEQDFNSLHAQRDACEAYVLSQTGEGWTALPAHYDDGGISGGTLERPALQRLLQDIRQGRVDVVVVYKIDRLTRSLTDFAKIVDVFDAGSVSFVSVTQAFNTTSSMGRLTLNVLLSFAQFEREVTSERIRDKIAASKRKGLWMGGTVPLGYDAQGRTLIPNPTEAEQVRWIFSRYLELRSVHRLKEELDRKGWVSKSYTSASSGRSHGGVPIARGALFYMLGNRIYLGEIPHKAESHPGQHPAIVDRVLFEQVQAVLQENRRKRAASNQRVRSAPLTGKIFDADGAPMTPTISHGAEGRRYRYYVSAALQQGGKATDRDALLRLPAPPLEAFVLTTLQRLGLAADAASLDAAASLILRMIVRADSVVLTFDVAVIRAAGNEAELLSWISGRLGESERAWLPKEDELAVSLPTRLVFRGGRTRVLRPVGAPRASVTRPDRALISALRKAHVIARSPSTGKSGWNDPYQRRVIRLAFLAPDLQLAILEGRQPESLTLSMLANGELPACWSEQRRLVGA